jgi:hypothetical protein
MNKLWLVVIKPKGVYAKWFTFLALTAILIARSFGYFELARQSLDTDGLTFSI